MKKLLLILICLTILWDTSHSQEDSSDLGNLEWMLGDWQRINVRPNQTAVEKWHKVSQGEYAGIGLTMQQGDTVFIENLKLIRKDDDLFYVADVSHNPEPTYFKITEIMENGFTCEKPDHDFPKKIEYKLVENILQVVISGDGKSMGFTFERVRKSE